MSDRADPEAAAIEALAQEYFSGMYEGDVERLRRIFNPQCWLFGQNRSGHHQFPLSGFLDQIGSEPAPKAVDEPFNMRLVSFDRTASVAMAKVEVRYQNRRYTDYLMLQMTGDGWRIVGKAFFCPDP